mmetsp:Transcript_14258/g.22209  ORF Transcript_14258/g.22209 Transcript_14258/m.22209 type:complete len:142 (-) Transcript_14258:335-760(-)
MLRRGLVVNVEWNIWLVFQALGLDPMACNLQTALLALHSGQRIMRRWRSLVIENEIILQGSLLRSGEALLARCLNGTLDRLHFDGRLLRGWLLLLLSSDISQRLHVLHIAVFLRGWLRLLRLSTGCFRGLNLACSFPTSVS